jgi:hypothetical protein
MLSKDPSLAKYLKKNNVKGSVIEPMKETPSKSARKSALDISLISSQT